MEYIQSKTFTIDSGEISFFPFVAGEQQFSVLPDDIYAYAQITGEQQQFTLLLPTWVLEQMKFSETTRGEILWTNADNVSSNYFNKKITVEEDEFEVPYLDHAVLTTDTMQGQKICLLPRTDSKIHLGKTFAIKCSGCSDGNVQVYSAPSFIFTNLTNHVLGFGFISESAQSKEKFEKLTALIMEDVNDEG